jgi:hypothetical protein
MIDLVDCVAVKVTNYFVSMKHILTHFIYHVIFEWLQSADSITKKRNSLEIILKKERFLLIASTEMEKDEWIGQIGRALVKNSGMFINTDNAGDDHDNISDDSDFDVDDDFEDMPTY